MKRLAIGLMIFAMLIGGGTPCSPPTEAPLPSVPPSNWNLNSADCGTAHQFFMTEPDGDSMVVSSSSAQPASSDFTVTMSNIAVSITCDTNGIRTANLNMYTLSIVIADSGGCTSNPIDITVTFTDIGNDPPEITPDSIDIFRRLFEKDGQSDVHTFQATGDITSLSIAGTDPVNAPFSFSTRSLILTGSLQSFPAVINLTVNGLDENGVVVHTDYVAANVKDAPELTQPVHDEDIYFCEDFSAGDVIYSITSTNPNGGDITIDVTYQDPPTDPARFTANATAQTLALSPDVNEGDFDVDVDGANTEYKLTLSYPDVRVIRVRDNEVQLISDGTYESEINVTAHVDDVNDIPPSISAIDPILVFESVPGGTNIYNFTVTDADSTAPNNEVSLSISGDKSEHFTIDGFSLLVASNSQLNYGTNAQYNITLNATDKAEDGEELSTLEDFQINLETAPVFSSDQYTASIAENIQPSDLVKEVTVTDEDDQDGSTHTYSLEDDMELFTMDGPIIRVATGADLTQFDVDDGDKSFDLRVVVTDDKYQDTTSVAVTGTDVNDKSPVFEEDGYTVSMNEGTPSGENFLNVSATDADKTSPNKDVTYSLSGPDAGHFDIADSGAVTIKDLSSLDYTDRSFYSLTVTAVDGGSPALEASVDLNVTLETTPVFLNPAIGEEPTVITEDIAADEVIYIFSGEDEDNSAVLNYFLVHESLLTASLFVIAGDKLKTVPNLADDGLDVDDSPDVRQFNLTVRVMDGQYSTEANVVIDVTDVNDISPQFVQASSIVPINENHTGLVYTVTATDGDLTEPNNQIDSYAIVDGDMENIFEINSTTGEVSVIKDLKEDTYSLTVRATDRGNPPRSKNKTLNILVDDVIDECASNPCQNGATCRRNVNYYFCECDSGWAGINCNINIDDCAPNPCQNGGDCQDGVAEYTCNCAAGWRGTNCTIACTGHTHGRNCAESCSCNVTNIAANAASQRCNVQTGVCFCNNHWTGSDCNSDAEECTPGADLCSDQYSICVDTFGSFECICITGYTARNSICGIDNSQNNPAILPDAVLQAAIQRASKLVYVRASLNLQICPKLNKPSVYSRVKTDLQNQVRTKLGTNRAYVYNLTCNSLDYDTFIEAQNEAEVVSLSSNLKDFKDSGTLQIENEVVSVISMGINGNTVSETPSLCEVYESVSPCGTDYTCEVQSNGTPTCREKEADNTGLILGLGLGIGCGLVFIIMSILICLHCYRSSGKRSLPSRQYSDDYSSHDKPYAYTTHDYPHRQSYRMSSFDKGASRMYDNRRYHYNGDSYFYKGKY